MDIDSTDRGTIVTTTLKKGEEIFAESDALVAARPNSVAISTTGPGSFLGGLKRIFMKESPWKQRLSATEDDTTLYLSPKDGHGLAMLEFTEEDDSFYVCEDGYFASTTDVAIDVHVGFLGRFLQGNLFAMKICGQGQLIVEGRGRLGVFPLASKETMRIDNGHLIAWSCRANLQIIFAARTLWGSVKSGEGLHVLVKGPCTVCITYSRPLK